MIKKIKNLIYIYQLSEYDNLFFFSWIKNHQNLEEYFNSEAAKFPVWTAKAKMIFWLAILFTPFFKKNLYISLILAAKIIKPFENIVVFFIVRRAQSKLKKYKDLIKIGITGSYGKTTTKEYLAAVLSEKYRVLKTPENINTLIGISRLILKELNESYQIFVAEMAAYKRSDIKRLCGLINPQIGILTGLAGSHLERFGSIENIVRAKFELVDGLNQKNGRFFMNADNDLIIENYRKFVKTDFEFYGINENINKKFNARNIELGENFLKFEIYKEGKFYFKTEVNLLGRHQLEPLLAAITVADNLGLTKDEMVRGLKKIRPLPRRLFPIKTPQGIIIDDSYNISEKSIEAALDYLTAVFMNKRKVVLTAGIVEQGNRKSENNIFLGQKLKEGADLILTPKNSNTRYIIKGLGLPEDKISEYNKIIIFNNAKEIDSVLSRILKPDDVVLIFPYNLPAHYL